MKAQKLKVALTLAMLGACEPALAAPVGTMTSLSGRVFVRRAQEPPASAGKVAKVNEPLYEGDLIETSEESSAKLMFLDDSIMDLGPKTAFKIEAFKGTNTSDRSGVFNVLYGKLRALVTRAIGPGAKIEIKTATSVMGVRGTEFVVNAQRAIGAGGLPQGTAAKTELVVVSGSVGLSIPRGQGQPVVVGAASAVSTHAGMQSIPAPQLLSPGQLGAIVDQARVADNTFTRTVSVDSGVKNESAPTEATALSIATTSMEAAALSLSENADGDSVQGTGVFGALDAMTDTPAIRIPGNFQTVTVKLVR